MKKSDADFKPRVIWEGTSKTGATYRAVFVALPHEVKFERFAAQDALGVQNWIPCPDAGPPERELAAEFLRKLIDFDKNKLVPD